MDYEKVQEPRFSVENERGSEIITIKAQRHFFVMLFLGFWLCGWSVGGFSAISSLMQNFSPFLMFWLGMWALGMIAVIGTLSWMLTGKEVLRVTGSDLEIGYACLGYSRRKLYRGSTIRDLGVNRVLDGSNSQNSNSSLPIGNSSGRIRFTYGARDVYAGGGLDVAEAQLIVERLRKRLPYSVAPSA